MRKVMNILLVLFVIVTAAQGAAPQPDIAPFIAREVEPGVHLLAVSPDYVGMLPSNVEIIEQSDGMVVVDAGVAKPDGRRIADYIHSITRKPVKALLFTHWHYDHLLGASEIRARWPKVRIISTKATLETLERGSVQEIGLEPKDSFIKSQQDQIRGLIGQIDEQLNNPKTDEARRQRYARIKQENLARIDDFPGTYLTLPTETFTKSLLLNDPVRPVRLVYLGRANTDGDAIAWLPKQRIVMTGDTVVSPVPFGFDSYPADWIQTLGRIKALGFRTVIPGHGEPQSDTVYIDKLIAAIEGIRAAVAPLAKSGLSLDEVRKKVDLNKVMDLFGDTPRIRANAESLFFEPMIPNAYKEARGEPIIQSGTPVN